jgi:chaperone modulatory protein CbpM
MTQLIEIHSPSFHISFTELCVSADISQDALLELIDNEIAVPISGAQPAHWQFHNTCVALVKKAVRLNRDLDIEWADLNIVLNLLGEVELLKNENERLKQQLLRFFC